MKGIQQIGRRTFLRGGAAVVALPFLESFGFRRFAGAAKVAAEVPKRMVFLGMGYGVTKETWFPDKKKVGKDWEFTPGLKPLERHRDAITVVQNLQNQFSNEAHWGSTFWLTGANRYAEPGQSFHNSVSADQVAAEVLGQDTRFGSMQLGCKKADGHGPGLSLAWNRQGKPMAGYDTPVAAYQRLFSDDKTPLAERRHALKERRSVLDAVLEDAKSVKRGLTKTDTDKIEEYFESIREIEVRLSKEEDWLEVPKARPEGLPGEPGGGIAGVEEVKVMYDLIVAAMQVDATRVLTYRMPVESLIASMGATISAHNMSHYDQGERRDVSEARDVKHAEMLAYFIDRLKATKEVDGSSLWDHAAVTFGSNISTVHHLTNCPTVLTGGGAGVKHGRHLVMEDAKTPLCNLWLSLLQGIGVDVESHGDSTGVVDALFRA